MPAAGFGDNYYHKNLYEMAAAYLFHILCNHPFIDGNKRTGAVSAFVFLALNGIELRADELVFEKLVLDVANGKADKTMIADFIKKHSRKTQYQVESRIKKS